MLRRLLPGLAVWTAACAATAPTIAWLLPVAIAPAARFDHGLVRVCAAVAVPALAGLWAAAGVAVFAATRPTAT